MLDTLGMVFHELVGEANENGVIPFVLLVAPFDHFLTYLKRQPFGFGVMRTCGRQHQFLYSTGVIQSQQLGNPASHGMSYDDGIVRFEVIHQPDYVPCKHLGRIVNRWLTRLPSAAIVVNDDSMVFRKLGHLMDFPNFSIACSFAQKHYGLAMAMNFVIDLCVGQL